MDKAKPNIIHSYPHQIAELVKKFNRPRTKAVKPGLEMGSKSQEEYLAEARANLAISLDAARADYLKSGKPLLTIEDLDAEITAIRGEIE